MSTNSDLKSFVEQPIGHTGATSVPFPSVIISYEALDFLANLTKFANRLRLCPINAQGAPDYQSDEWIRLRSTFTSLILKNVFLHCNNILLYSPTADALINTIREWFKWSNPDVTDFTSVEIWLRYHRSDCDRLLHFVWMNIQNSEIAKFESDLIADSKRRERQTCDYINHLFERHSRLLVLRVDFYLGSVNTRFALNFSSEHDSRSNFLALSLQKQQEELINYLDIFLRNRRHNRLFRHQVGYIARMEFGLLRGYHLHCAFFLNGNMVRHSYQYAKLYGQYWAMITANKGTSYNCNRYMDRYKLNGIGEVKAYDHEKRQNLTLAISYLCKPDPFHFPNSGKRFRFFRKGEIDSGALVSKPGPKRKHI